MTNALICLLKSFMIRRVLTAWSWLAMALACVVVPWVLYLTIPINTLAQALLPSTLWDGLWPLLLAVLLYFALERWNHLLPRIPAGDVGVILVPLGRANALLGVWAERLDRFARRWDIATITLISLAILFVLALR